ncbi:MAG: tetratricopeptide repeat protein [Aureliella sp.]
MSGSPSAPSASTSLEEQQTQLILSAVEEGKMLFRAGQYLECINAIDKAIALSPEDPDLLQFRGYAYFANGNVDESSADIYDALLVGNTWNWQAVYDLYRSKDKYELHLRRLEQLRAAEPSMSTHFALGYQYLVLNHLARGKKEIEKALVFQPEEPLMTQLVLVVGQMVEAPKQ